MVYKELRGFPEPLEQLVCLGQLEQLAPKEQLDYKGPQA